ncbi:MAG: homoserine kinase [Pseudonocardia sp.]
MRSVRVRVPASSANLGPGFDTLGLALALHDEIEVETAAAGLVVEVSGEGAGQVPVDDTHLVVRAMNAAWDVLGGRPAGLRLRCRNRIPHSRGLGSSAAAAVAGAVAAAALADCDVIGERDALLQLTAGLEGHADNAAASLLGGLVVAWEASGNTARRFDAVRLDAHPGIAPVALIAKAESSTAMTRGLLPAHVPLADAAFTGSRTALAVLAFTARPELLMPATEDRLHQSYRRPAYPESADLVDALRHHGIPAAISGAGPTVLAFTRDGRLPDGLDLSGFTPCPLAVDGEGVYVETG